jgi:ABC-2 type transport system ATP-binding protein
LTGKTPFSRTLIPSDQPVFPRGIALGFSGCNDHHPRGLFSMNPIIQLQNLSRSFGSNCAINNLSFDVEEGEVFGLLGPNGSGKTTLVRLLNGVLLPSSGTARLFGRDVTVDGACIRARTGVLTETPSLYEHFTAKKNLAFFGRFYGIPDADLSGRVTKILGLLNLADRADEPVGGFSKGMKQRLAIARALIHDPQVIFLDEPTSGLDPESSRQVDGIIRELAADKGKTIFLCTHNLNEAQHLSSRVALINRGTILALGSIQELNERLWKALPVEMEFLSAIPEAVPRSIREIGGVTVERVDEKTLTLRVSRQNLIPLVIQAAIRNGGALFRVTPRDYSLEEIYFAVQEQGGITA